MTTRARTLDIIIAHIGSDRVYYGFPVGELKLYYADIYPEGKFDLSTIQVGKRYHVQTTQMPCQVPDPTTGQVTTQQRYVWTSATEVVPKAPLQTYTAKQRKAKAWLASTTPVDNGTLIKW